MALRSQNDPSFRNSDLIIPEPSKCVTCLPFGRFFGEKAHMLHSWKDPGMLIMIR